MSPNRASIRNTLGHLYQRIRRHGLARGIPLLTALTLLLGASVPLFGQTAERGVDRAADRAADRPWRFADNVVLHIPGSSRFAGDVYGADSVQALLAALARYVATDSASIELYATAEGRQLALKRAAVRLTDDPRRVTRTVELVVIPTFNAQGAVQTLDVFIEDLPAFDKRAPRDDGRRTASLAMQRNLEQVRALYGRGGAARFIAGNAHQVVVLFDQSADPKGTRGEVMRYRFDAAGRVKQVEQFAPSGLVSMALRTTGR